MEKIVTKIKDLAGKLIPYSLPIKVVVGTFFAILGGSGLLGLLSEFATYSYAISYGFRPPVEGVPYLRASITFISIVLLLGSVAGFFLIYSIAKLNLLVFEIPKYIHNKHVIGRKNDTSLVDIVSRVRSKSTKEVVLMSIGLGAFAGVLILVALYFEINGLSHVGFDLFEVSGVTFVDVVLKYLGVACAAFVIYLSVFRPSIIKLIAGAGVLAVLLGVPVLMFHTDTYAGFMRLSGFGGGKKVSVSYGDEKDSSSINLVSGGLLIRTSEFVIIYVGTSDEIVEIPVLHINEITYTNTNDYELPKREH